MNILLGYSALPRNLRTQYTRRLSCRRLLVALLPLTVAFMALAQYSSHWTRRPRPPVGASLATPRGSASAHERVPHSFRNPLGGPRGSNLDDPTGSIRAVVPDRVWHGRWNRKPGSRCRRPLVAVHLSPSNRMLMVPWSTSNNSCFVR